MKIRNNSTIIITTAICFLPMFLYLALYDKLPAKIPIHFNSTGDADNYMPKVLVTFGLPLGFALLNLFVHFTIDNDPKRAGMSEAMKNLRKWIVPVTADIVMPMSLFISLGYSIPIHIIVPALAGILIMFCGNYLPKSRQNYTLGIKLPWTLHDEDNWNKTHRLAGVLWIAGGLILTVGSFMQLAGPVLMIAVVATMLIVPFIYSFVLYRGTSKN